MIDRNLLAKISEDRALASSVIFGHRHQQGDAALHVEIMDLWGCMDELVLIEAFRDAGKTTKAEEAVILEGCFGNFPYGLILGETYTKGCQRLEAIGYECKRNTKLHRLFGGEVLARKPTENRLWFKSGALLEAGGWEQELQSFKYHESRPSFCWLDDIENRERVRDSATVTENVQKFYLELLPALSKVFRRIRFTQTRRAEDCMVTRFARSSEWVYRGFPICDRDPDDPFARSNWPSKYPMEWIRAEMRKFAAEGMRQEFKQAYMLQVVNMEAKPFKEDQLGAMDFSPYFWAPKFTIYDPARTSDAEQSDRTGSVTVSRVGTKILIHESKGAFWKPSEFVEALFASAERNDPVKIGVEKNSLDDWIMQPLRLKMIERGFSLPVVALQAPQDRSKEQFILGLQPFAEAGDIVLVGGKSAHPQLVAEWANFPSGPRDILNALAYSLRMFSGQRVYPDFGVANLGDAPNPSLGETIHVAFHASTAETVFVALLRDGRRLSVAADGSAWGPDAVKTLAFELRATFPKASFQVWVAPEVHDQWQRIPLVASLRDARLAPGRGEYLAKARGSLADRISRVWRDKRLLVVDKKAKLTVNALAAGYVMPVLRGGRVGDDPEAGVSRLIGEALETVVAMLDRSAENEQGLPAGANVGHTAQGTPYITSHPGLRRR